MNIQALKRWHWIVVGLVAGSILAWAKMMAVSDQMIGGPGYVSQARFEAGLNELTFDGNPAMTGIAIRPRGDVDIVRFHRFDPVIRYEDTYLFAAHRPYVRMGATAPASPDYRVADYLAEVAARSPKLSFRYAWWESPRMMTLIYALAGAALIGGLWPNLLRLMVGAGLGRPEPEYDLDRFKGEAAPAKETSELSDAERQHLADLEAEMMAGLSGAAGDVEPAAAEANAATVKILSAEEVAALPRGPGENKAFAGQFYPVEKKAPHGFTVVELLVVIGIIVMLAALLLPVLSQARERANTVKCASNLKQVGAGLEIYNQVNKHLPLNGKPVSLVQAMEEMNIAGVMVCPSDPTGPPSYTMNTQFAGMPKTAGDPTDILASESGTRHVGGPNILYFDGHVEEKQQ